MVRAKSQNADAILFKEKSSAKIGVLLINLGSPQGTDYRSMRRYLRQFLSDRRVIDMSRLLWYPILYGLILTSRPQKSGEKYQQIWNYAKNEPPLISFTRSQAQKLQQRLNNPDISVNWAMRYGSPSVETVCNEMLANGCEKLLFFPLYPHYCAATTASTLDACFATLKKRRLLPAVRSVPSYPDDPAYIHALASSIRQQLDCLDFKPQRLIASYHGLPLSYVIKGDPYVRECERTTYALRKALNLDENHLLMSFQSRFGREVWLQPYTDETVTKLAREGVESIAVVNPGFVSDCLETLDEMGHEVARLFRQAGGKNFAHIPCLNDSEAGLDVLETIIRRELSGWL